MNNTARPIVWLLAVSSFILHPSSFAQAHEGAVRMCERAGGYQLAAFTAPTPFRTGPVDVSVLVQDAATGECVTSARVTLHLTARGSGQVLESPATSGAASNKLFHEAVFELPEPGWWDVEVSVDGPHGPARARFAVEAGEAPPRWLDLWPWFGWPALAVALFGLHRVFCRAAPGRSHCRSPILDHSYYDPRCRETFAPHLAESLLSDRKADEATLRDALASTPGIGRDETIATPP